MKKIGAAGLHRLLFAVLALTLLLAAVPAQAAELAGWENIAVSVVWTDEAGNAWQYPAVKVPGDTGITYGWWVTLPPQAVGSAVSLQIVHPDPAYSYWLNDMSMTLHWAPEYDAQSLEDRYAHYVGYSVNGMMQTFQMQDCMKLYLSSAVEPFDLPEGEDRGSVTLLPGGYEGFGPGGGQTDWTTPPSSQPAAPANAVVTVYYKHVNGKTLDVQDVTLAEGAHTLWPESSKVSGLNLTGNYPQTVTVYAGGYADVASVTFLYEDAYTPPVEADIEVYYVTLDGTELDRQTLRLTEGTHRVTPQSSRTGGYELISDSAVSVTVRSDGWTDTASVTFYYEQPYVAPREATIPVYYYHQDGQELDMVMVTLPEGTHTITPDSRAVSGLELVSEGSQRVTVYADGSASVQNVVFLYRDGYTAPITGEVTVMYLREDGTIIDQQVITLAQGNQTVLPESRKVSGMTLVSEASVKVYVDKGGAASPNPVTFVYRDKVQQAAKAQVTVYIYDTYGREIAAPQTLTLTPGTHVIEAPAGSATPGYELVSEAILTVTVYDDGSYTPSGEELSFWYREAQDEVETIIPTVTAPPAQTARITLRYLDDRGRDIASEQVIDLGEGTHTVTPDMSHVPAGYAVFEGAASATVKVRSGRASQDTVSFYFVKEQTAPAVHQISVYYYDTFGNEIAPRQTLSLQSGTHRITASPERLPAGYTLASEASFDLRVGEDGSLDRAPQDVGFWYSQVPVEVKKAVVTVRYVDQSGHTIAGPFTSELEGGQSYLISPEASAVPAGYDLSGAKPVTVQVTADGHASPAAVSFVAEWKKASSQLPVGEMINRYGVVNSSSVAVRTEPGTKGGNGTVILRMPKGGMVYMVASEYNDAGEVWTQIIADGRTGYMQTKFIDMLTAEASEAYVRSAGATPVPAFTPTPAPTEGFVEAITPAPYVGYAVLQGPTALRAGTGSVSSTLDWLAKDELVTVNGQQQNMQTGETWSSVRTLDGVNGYVPSSSLTRVSDQEAAWRIELWQQQNASPAPTQLVTNTPQPEQLQGYAWTTANDVPLRRTASEQSRIIDYLPYRTAVFITGQTYADGLTWQNVATLDGTSGYIRGDLVRLMTEREENDYLNSTFNTPTPSPTPTMKPESSLSGYGYVTKNAVNFRSGPSTSSSAIDQLNRYAMAVVLGSQREGNVTWYHVNYNGTKGYIHGDYFKVMTRDEFNSFYMGDLYREGLANNGGNTKPDDEDDNVSGGQNAQRPQATNDWNSSGNVALPSFAPFDPVGTVQPINPTATPTLEPLPGYVTQGSRPTATPTAAPTNALPGGTDNTLPLPGTGNVTYPMQGESRDSSLMVWIAVIALLLLAGGGGIALAQHQRRKRLIAQRAAQRRAQQARSAQPRPQARPMGAQPRTGAYPSYGNPQQSPLFSRSEERPTGGSGAASAQQTGGQAQRTGEQRMGRRTAYQQRIQNDQKD